MYVCAYPCRFPPEQLQTLIDTQLFEGARSALLRPGGSSGAAAGSLATNSISVAGSVVMGARGGGKGMGCALDRMSHAPSVSQSWAGSRRP